MDPKSDRLGMWLAELRAYDTRADQRSMEHPYRWFPDDDLFEEFIAGIHAYSEDDIQLVLRSVLISQCATGGDRMGIGAFIHLRNAGSPEAAAALDTDPHLRRVFAYYSGKTDQLPRDGLQWVLNLLPDKPKVALSAIDSYFQAYMWHMSDNLVHALGDAEAVIRARYIGLPEQQSDRQKVLHGLQWRKFEILTANLYSEMGYEAEVTSPQRDGGRDVIAMRRAVGQRERVLVQCKRSKKKVGVETVDQLIGVVSHEKANKGVIVTSAAFTSGARERAANNPIELINGLDLVVLLNEHLGYTWPARLEALTRQPTRPAPWLPLTISSFEEV